MAQAESASQSDSHENPRTRFLSVEVPFTQNSDGADSYPNRSDSLSLLSRVLTLQDVRRVLDTRAIPDHMEVFYSVGPDFGERELSQLANMYAAAFGSSLPMWHLNLIECDCGDGGQCNQLHLQDSRTDFSVDYTDPLKRLDAKHSDAQQEIGVMGKLVEIMKVAALIDPEGEMDFDARLNKMTAERFGCDEIVQHQARVAPFGPEHISNQELKTLCFKVKVKRPKEQEPFIVMVNTMADRQVELKKIKAILKESGLGKKFDMGPADISEEFGIERGEVHPLSLTPKIGQKGSSLKVIHVYDQLLQEARYVTTNGGHPDWTTEFRSDSFLERIGCYFNTDEAEPLVFVDDISEQNEDESQQQETPSNNHSYVWEHTVEQVSEEEERVELEEEKTPELERKAALLVTESTTLFSQRVKETLSGLLQADEIRNTSLHRLAQPSLDFEIIKFPQCWRTIFEQLSIAVATMVREGINTVFLDCNIAPLEDIFADNMPARVRTYVLKVLRTHLGEDLKDVPDDELLYEINQRLKLLSKPVVIADHLREQAEKGNVKDVYLVGGEQITDPSMSKYHDQFISIGKYVKIHTLDPEQTRTIRDAMYFAEYDEEKAESRLQNVLQLYNVISPMLKSIEQSEKPLIVIASTSLCQAYHENGDTIIPKDLVPGLADKLGITAEVMEAKSARINAIDVLNTTDEYAKAAALNLATGIATYGKLYV